MTPETAKELLDFLLPQLRQETATTRKVLAAMPADGGAYKPSEKCMSGLDLATHIAAAEVFFLNGVIAGAFEWKQPELKTPAEVVAFYDATVPPLLDKVAGLSPEHLAKPITFAVFTEPGVGFLNLSMKHSVHHRGQLSAYLRPMGGKVPSIYGPSGDDSVEAAGH
jgi:uncharacterized damage-inducible protein DinB